ncbi:MAG TPA: plastocyanin/azurin family copper-binding protein [Solirubrobacterales bacterium]|nr:plastocyanin/azurin family copper-binding protein [Solirubrobacterales bacterium]
MKKIIALFALLLAALALVACGGGSSTEETGSVAGAAQEAEEKAEEAGEEAEGKAEELEKEAEGAAGGSGATVAVEADPSGNLAFTSEEITAKAGKDTIEFTNESPVPHDVKIEDSSGKEIGGTEVISEGSDTAEVELEPGTYTYFCSIPGHRQAGMEGTLVVK